MAQAVIFPKLGQTMEEGAIVQWLKQEGDPVVKGDILFEIETDKANLEVESFFEGVLLKIYVREGVTVPVNTVVGYIGAPGEKVPDQAPKPEAPAPAPKPVASPSPTPAAARVPVAEPAAAPAPVPARAPVPAPPSHPAPQPAKVPVPAARLVISPRAKTLAQSACINPARITGTGPNGRIVEKDVRAYLAASGYDALRITPAAKRLAAEKSIDILTVRGSGDSGRIMVEDIERAIRRKPVALSRMRQVIARRLVESKQTIPHFYVTVKADITDLMVFRSDLKARGLNYSVNDFVLEAVVLSLEEIPIVNSVTDGQTVSWRGDVDLGMAVSVDNGLVVPVIRAAQTLTFSELSAQAKALAEKARAGRLTPDEMTGSSFSVSNMGMLNVDQFTAIINPGEAGILAVSSGRQEPAVVNGEVRIRSRMAITLSVDHRIVDGAVGAQFANAVRSKLENIELWKSLV
ncbi:MAG TPA: dihydrolipoamide acetyltransferase family protein [Kiritimatiellia bacterium]|nr:dihydrolipoamide acetyltransferase family protein [Kiritimatiellia bacterium]HPC49320.1 dihydrolipoamide acetyltransferase family protein [Kiritimatiellia bacterium]HPW74450.1 dihydrolipoamide acetyltransferase family protein [Kiritimatiellia bacterium]HRU19362.1 dihydrolipoamide acetyltransferase family protein [Kiritimatiellia bacterium]